MQVALCMIVRDEAATIDGCLREITPLFSEIVIVDDNSQDDTAQRVTSLTGSAPTAPATDNRFLAANRNKGLQHARSPWRLILDADERVCANTLEKLFQAPPDNLDNIAGLFFPWHTYNDKTLKVRDYKLALVRSGFEFLGGVHETVTPDIRRKKQQADWHPDIVLKHYPDPARRKSKITWRESKLAKLADSNPNWIRYHWFLGYSLAQRGEIRQALPFLTHAARACSVAHPVESLNASMVLAHCQQVVEQPDAALDTVRRAMEFYDAVTDDFEVRINTRLRPWLEQAHRSLSSQSGELTAPYLFSH